MFLSYSGDVILFISFGSAQLGSKGVKVIWNLMSQNIKGTREMNRWYGLRSSRDVKIVWF